MIDPTNIPAWATYTAAGLGGTALATCLGWAVARARHHEQAGSITINAGSRVEDALTFTVAAVVAGICAQGMAHFFQDKLGFSVPVSRAIGGILELVAFTCALRARRAVRQSGVAGVDGVAVWAVAAASGAFAALDSGDPVTGLFRIFLALLAAWLWERGLAIERRYRRRKLSGDGRGDGRIRWRVSVERIACRVGLAEPQDRTAGEVDTARRITRLALATARLHTAQARHRSWFRGTRRAQARQHKAMRDALQRTGLAHDERLQRRLLAETAALIQAATFAEIAHRPFWAPQETTPQESAALGSGETGEPSPTTASLLARIRERRTDRRLGVRPAHRTGEARTEAARMEARTEEARTGEPGPEPRTGGGPQARIAPPLTLSSVRPLPLEGAPSGLGWLDRTDPSVPLDAARAVRAHGTMPSLLVRPVWPVNPVRPAEPSRARRPARTKKKGPARRRSAGTSSRKGRRSREYWIGVLAGEIRAAEAGGGAWEPVYDGPGGLRVRAGYERSWCEKTVRAAKKAARSPAHPRTDGPPVRTAAARTGEPLAPTDADGT